MVNEQPSLHALTNELKSYNHTHSNSICITSEYTFCTKEAKDHLRKILIQISSFSS